MIYMQLKPNGGHLLILEHGNLDHLRAGGTVTSPGGEVCLTATPDAQWLSAELESAARVAVLNSDLLFQLIADSRKRPVVNDRPFHGLKQIIRDGEVVPPEPEAA